VEAEGLHLTLVHAKAEDFIADAEARSFDAVSLRFALAYVDWRDVLPRIGRILRPRGRVGVLSSLSSSIPQLHKLYNRFRKSPEPALKLFRHTKGSLPETWRIYRQLRETYGEPRFIMVPDTSEQIARALQQGGLAAGARWTETIRLWFESGRQAVDWAIGSGYATHSSLERLAPEARRFVEQLFSAGMEGFRQTRGIPLDLVIGGVVAERR
jgi:SAM-dependent methyltransferase